MFWIVEIQNSFLFLIVKSTFRDNIPRKIFFSAANIFLFIKKNSIDASKKVVQIRIFETIYWIILFLYFVIRAYSVIYGIYKSKYTIIIIIYKMSYDFFYI